MTVKKQTKYDGFVIKRRSAHESPKTGGGRAARRYSISVNPSSQEDVLLPSPVESFRKSWEEAMSGQVKPLSQLWDTLDD